MPHTTTKNRRNKRPDTRPNEKDRRKKNKAIENSKTIQEIRVTKKQKGEKLEREASMVPLRPSDEVLQQRYVRSLTKKLKEIEALIQRQKRGEDLDKQQLSKIETLDETMSKMDKVISHSDRGSKNPRKKRKTDAGDAGSTSDAEDDDIAEEEEDDEDEDAATEEEVEEEEDDDEDDA